MDSHALVSLGVGEVWAIEGKSKEETQAARRQSKCKSRAKQMQIKTNTKAKQLKTNILYRLERFLDAPHTRKGSQGGGGSIYPGAQIFSQAFKFL